MSTVEQRVKIIQAYYSNRRSVKNAHRALNVSDPYNCPTEHTIFNTVHEFEATGSVVNVNVDQDIKYSVSSEESRKMEEFTTIHPEELVKSELGIDVKTELLDTVDIKIEAETPSDLETNNVPDPACALRTEYVQEDELIVKDECASDTETETKKSKLCSEMDGEVVNISETENTSASSCSSNAQPTSTVESQ